MISRALNVCVCAAIICSPLITSMPDTRSQESRPDYKNPALPVERRVTDLLRRMTPEEKVAQLTALWIGRPETKPFADFSTDRGEFSPEKAAQVMKHGIGQIARQREHKGPREGAVFANAVQKWLTENT